MATFKKFDNQQVYQLHTKSAIELAVGDVISYNPSSEEVAEITALSAAKQAMEDGLELYLVAQSDGVTYKSGKAYKTYILDDATVNATGDHVIVAYRIETLTNIEGLEA
jgi:hypothetical protein